MLRKPGSTSNSNVSRTSSNSSPSNSPSNPRKTSAAILDELKRSSSPAPLVVQDTKRKGVKSSTSIGKNENTLPQNKENIVPNSALPSTKFNRTNSTIVKPLTSRQTRINPSQAQYSTLREEAAPVQRKPTMPRPKGAPKAEILAAINVNTSTLDEQARQNQRSGNYNCDEWEVVKLETVMRETGGKLVCSLPMAIHQNWDKEQLAALFTALEGDWSRLTPEHLAAIQKLKFPRGVSQYFAMPDSFRHNRLHPEVPGQDHHSSYVEYTQIAAGVDKSTGKPRPHKSCLWVFKLPAWMGEINVAFGHARANTVRPLADAQGRALINPETDGPIMEEIGSGGGKQIFVTPVTIALIMAHALKIIIQDVQSEQFEVLQAQWDKGKLTVSSKKEPTVSTTPFKFFVNPCGSVFEVMPARLSAPQIGLMFSDAMTTWRIVMTSYLFFIKMQHTEHEATLVMGFLQATGATFGSLSLRDFNQAVYGESEPNKKERALVPYVPPNTALVSMLCK